MQFSKEERFQSFPPSQQIERNFSQEPQQPKITNISCSATNDDTKDDDSNCGNEGNQLKINSQRRSSKQSAYMNLFKGYLGSGILALPYAFNEAGWLLSSFIFLVVSLIIYQTMILLFKLANSYDNELADYTFLAKDHFGEKGVISMKVFIVMFQVGCCISYVIFFLKFLENVFKIAGYEQNDLIYLTIALTIIIPMSFINNITQFATYSIIANVMIAMALLAIFGFNATRIGNLSDEEFYQNIQNLGDFSKIPMLIGVSIYSFEAIGLIFSIRNSIENPKKTFPPIFKNVNILMVSLYISFSIIGVIAQGRKMEEIILFNLPNCKIQYQFFQIIYAFALILSYPLQLLPSFHIIEGIPSVKNFIFRNNLRRSQDDQNIIENNDEERNKQNSIKVKEDKFELEEKFSKFGSKDEQIVKNNHKTDKIREENTESTLNKNEEINDFRYEKSQPLLNNCFTLLIKGKKYVSSLKGRRIFLRICISLLICSCAYSIPRFAIFLNIIGAVAGVSLQFIFPISMYLKSFGDSIKKSKKYLLLMYLVIGLIGGVTSFLFSLVSLFQSRDGQQ